MKFPYFLFVVLISISARAEDACDKAFTTPEVNKCAEIDYRKSDKKLNVAYQDALRRMESWIEEPGQKKDTKQGLVEAQRLWVQFRDKDCGAIYDLWRDGTIRGAMYWGCMTAHTDTRAKELDSFAQGR
ncbi:MAG TPA: lysozyme inhibitor LprI family protein [Saprospiraceae bacterium]|nr:lysozyme inhibitor LprI family protein [Saprospiraceae bacterium]